MTVIALMIDPLIASAGGYRKAGRTLVRGYSVRPALCRSVPRAGYFRALLPVLAASVSGASVCAPSGVNLALMRSAGVSAGAGLPE